MNPGLHFVAPSPASAAAWLLERASGSPPDLGDTLVILPTQGAIRAVRAALAALSPRGVLSPVFRLPMEAVLPDADDIASMFEREAAWAEVLRRTSRERFAALVPPATRLDAPEDLLGVAGLLNEVCDSLAAAGLDPSSDELRNACANDAPRWQDFAFLHGLYLHVLESAGRRDPNAARIANAGDPEYADTLKRVVVVAVPDLPVVVEKYLCALSAKGVEISVVSWSAPNKEARFDAWGRPDPVWWKEHPVAVPKECLVVGNTSQDEAASLTDFAATQTRCAFISAAPESTVCFEAELSRRGAMPYLPDGLSLAQTECATIVLGWREFLNEGNLRSLRRLLQLPAFARLSARHGKDHVTPQEIAEACDRILAEGLCETFEAACDWHKQALVHSNKSAKRIMAVTGILLDGLSALQRRNPTDRELLEMVYRDESVGHPWRDQGIRTLMDLIDEERASPLCSALSPDMLESALRREIARRKITVPAPDGSIEILGWLEALWTTSPSLCIGGCREGALPSGVHEDVFLPDMACDRLGLPSQATRYARDAYILSCLVGKYGAEHLRLGTSRFRPGGDPNCPSRLLFGCSDDELPSRVEKLFQPAIPVQRPRNSPQGWKLTLPKAQPVTAIRVTGFKHYLSCPLRFYLSQVLGLQSFDAEAREINAADYGTLIHRVLENFHKSGGSSETDERKIDGFLQSELEREVSRRYGRHPSPVVRVQVESMRVRLRHFARLQADERRSGWRIIESEYAVDKSSSTTIGPLLLTGTMDRIEVHDELGLRIADYKTFSRARSPEETHFGPARVRPHLPEAAVSRLSKRGQTIDKSWIDLQLPLYRRLARSLWPEHASKGLSAGYILLPGDPEDTRFEPLSIDESVQSSAEQCAGAIARLVGRGVFWPPAPPETIEYDDFADWFGGEDPASLLEAKTIKDLEGRT